MSYQFLKKRWSWRQRRESISTICIVTQYFPPDFAPTGQLLNDIVNGLAQNQSMRFNILTGMPSYAYRDDRANRLEIKGNAYIRRSIASRLWPKRIRGRAINGIFFALRTFTRLLRNSRRGELVVITSEPPYILFFGLIVRLLFGTSYILIVYDVTLMFLSSWTFLKRFSYCKTLGKIKQFMLSKCQEYYCSNK